MTQTFQLPASYKKWTWGLILAGVIALVYGIITMHPFDPVAHHGAAAHGAEAHSAAGTRFWAVLLQNSVFWLLVVNASMFFICVTTMAMGGWQVAFRRVPEAISSLVPLLGLITFLILMAMYGEEEPISIIGLIRTPWPPITSSKGKADSLMPNSLRSGRPLPSCCGGCSVKKCAS